MPCVGRPWSGPRRGARTGEPSRPTTSMSRPSMSRATPQPASGRPRRRLILLDRRSGTCQSRRFQGHLLEARDLDHIAVLDIEGDAGHCPALGVAAEDYVDALVRDDEGAALPTTGGGDISTRPKVLSDRPGSCIKGYRTLCRHERR